MRADHYMPVTLESPVDEPHTLVLEDSRSIDELIVARGHWLAAS
jgi:hypothetical protein